MKETSKTLKSRIEYILKVYPISRNSDSVLQALLWGKFYKLPYEEVHTGVEKDGELLGRNYFVPVLATRDGKFKVDDKFLSLPLGETVKRHRAHIQNKEYKYLPTSLKVARRRKIKAEKIRAYYQYDRDNEITS